MANYDFRHIEKKWQKYWKENRCFVAEKLSSKPKYYVLDMFPYPSGSGLHVGHPLGYIATDIVARYKRIKGFNVLHPMGFDAFGLPAEQHAIKTGIHPSETTRVNTERFLHQMEILGLYHDPEAVFRTSDPDYYRWTQWIFLKLFGHWYDKAAGKARPVESLVQAFSESGNANIQAATSQKEIFSAAEWNSMQAKEQAEILMNYRLAFNSFATVNWCPALGTVLANEEIKDGRSERGGFPVEKRPMRQWILRITAYADRLLEGLDEIDWPESIRAIQKNWIGRSEGASILYDVDVEGLDDRIEVFTTRPDTLYGNTYMVLAPEHDLVGKITTAAQKTEVEAYLNWAKSRSEVDRMADTTKTGVFTGAFAIHPFTGKKLPIWVADYVLISYGTGAIMAVPAHDVRDYEFAKKFGLEVIEVISGGNIEEAAYDSKEGIMVHSDFLNGLKALDAIPATIAKLEKMGIGKGEITYRIRDVIWSRQRYWGEPTPIIFRNGIAEAVPDAELPVTLPEVETYEPSGTPESPLSLATDWVNLPDGGIRETNTMPGLAGSSWYFMRYPDASNQERFADKRKLDYWLPVDLYLGGDEHAVGHLLYSRFWTKFLHDLGEVSVEEPFAKLINQGKIQGVSQLAFRHIENNQFVSADLIGDDETGDYSPIHADLSLVDSGNRLNVDGYKSWTRDHQANFRLNEAGEFITRPQVEKMSKSLYNTVNPDDICRQYGTDTFRMYEMFLGPLEMDKPWNTEGIEGVSKFLRKAWSLFYSDKDEWAVSNEAPVEAELRVLHKMIRKIEEDVERLSFNTCVPAFMIFVRDIAKLQCNKRAILEPFLIAISPFAPHFAEELWGNLGHQTSILEAGYPAWDERYLIEDTVTYPVQVNGKVRAKVDLPADMSKEEVEKAVLAHDQVAKWLEGKTPRKVIVVPGKIVNVVI